MRRAFGQQQSWLLAAYHRDQHRRLAAVQRITIHLRAQKLKARQKIIQGQIVGIQMLALQLMQDAVHFIKRFLIFRVCLAVGHNPAAC